MIEWRPRVRTARGHAVLSYIFRSPQCARTSHSDLFPFSLRLYPPAGLTGSACPPSAYINRAPLGNFDEFFPFVQGPTKMNYGSPEQTRFTALRRYCYIIFITARTRRESRAPPPRRIVCARLLYIVRCRYVSVRHRDVRSSSRRRSSPHEHALRRRSRPDEMCSWVKWGVGGD